MNFGTMFSNWGGDKPAAVTPTAPATDPNATSPAGGVKQNDVDPDAGMVNDVWKALAPKADLTKVDPNAQPTGNQQQQRQVDPAADVAAHLKAQGLDPIVLTPEEITGLSDGTGTQGIVDKINSRIQNAYVKSMQNVNTLVDAKIAKVLSDANKNTTDTLKGVELKGFLETSIPYIKGNPLLGPVAETAFKTFYERTEGDKDRAVKLTRDFLKRAATEVAENDPDLKRNFNRETFNSPAGASDTNWLDVLKGK